MQTQFRTELHCAYSVQNWVALLPPMIRVFYLLWLRYPITIDYWITCIAEGEQNMLLPDNSSVWGWWLLLCLGIIILLSKYGLVGLRVWELLLLCACHNHIYAPACHFWIKEGKGGDRDPFLPCPSLPNEFFLFSSFTIFYTCWDISWFPGSVRVYLLNL